MAWPSAQVFSGAEQLHELDVYNVISFVDAAICNAQITSLTMVSARANLHNYCISVHHPVNAEW